MNNKPLIFLPPRICRRKTGNNFGEFISLQNLKTRYNKYMETISYISNYKLTIYEINPDIIS